MKFSNYIYLFQEYVPSGRQQILRHPGPLEINPNSSVGDTDDFLLKKFKTVSLLDGKHIEWWILRKVETTFNTNSQEHQDYSKCDFYNKSYIRDNISKSRPSEKFEESSGFRTGVEMSFNKFGKRVSDASCAKTPNKRLSVGSEQGKDTKQGLDINKSNTGSQRSPHKSIFQARTNPTHIEDELYVKGHTVVWSRGLVNSPDYINNGRKTICCYTLDLPIQKALWSTFYCERPTFGENDNLLEMVKGDVPTGTPMESICVANSHTVKVFTTKGEDFTISIPFVVGKLWNTRYGIFIEKENQSEFIENFTFISFVLFLN